MPAVMLGRGFAPSPYPAIWLPDNALVRLAFGYFSRLRTRSQQQQHSLLCSFLLRLHFAASSERGKHTCVLVTETLDSCSVLSLSTAGPSAADCSTTCLVLLSTPS